MENNENNNLTEEPIRATEERDNRPQFVDTQKQMIQKVIFFIVIIVLMILGKYLF